MFKSFLVSYGNWLFHYRDKVFPVVLVALFVGFRPHSLSTTESTEHWLVVLGFAVATLGQSYRWLAIGLAYIKRGGLNKRVYAKDLVTDGLFAQVRNPLYGGNLLILAGLLILHNSLGVYLLGGVFFGLAYLAIVAAEERYLTEKFPAYLDYCRDVPRWWPRWTGLRETLSGMQFHWQRALLRDSASCGRWVLAGLGILALDAVRNGHEPGRGDPLWAGLVALLLVYGIIRWLKKRGVLSL